MKPRCLQMFAASISRLGYSTERSARKQRSKNWASPHGRRCRRFIGVHCIRSIAVYISISVYLVGGWATPLKKYFWENKIDVPNHQPNTVLSVCLSTYVPTNRSTVFFDASIHGRLYICISVYIYI